MFEGMCELKLPGIYRGMGAWGLKNQKTLCGRSVDIFYNNTLQIVTGSVGALPRIGSFPIVVNTK